jgi:hydrogenase maturation protease
MKKLDKSTIVLGIGNNGRQDDGLGWAFIDDLSTADTDFDIEYRYQLQIEDAERISKYQRVIFIDATKEKTNNGFYFRICQPAEKYNFSTHALTPETILYLTKQLYNHSPEASVLAIEGYEWQLQIGLSDKASQNLIKAKDYFNKTVLSTVRSEQKN